MQIFTYNFYKEMLFDKYIYDLSEFNKNSPFYDEKNKKVIEKFKNKVSDSIIIEFLVIRPKCYKFKTKKMNVKRK